GKWIEVEWQAALEYVANGLRQIKTSAGAEHIGALATPNSTLEELALLQKLMRGMGSDNVDFRLRQADFSADGHRAGVPYLGMEISELNTRDRFLLVGSFLRKDNPLLAQRIRMAVKAGAQANVLHAAQEPLLMPVVNQIIVSPGELVNELAQVLKALAAIKNVVLSADAQAAVANVAISAAAQKIAQSLSTGERVAVLLGNFAQQHPQAVQLSLIAQQIATLSNASFGYLGEAANSVGGYVANAVPSATGMNAAQMLASPRKAYLLLNVEAELDTHDAQQAIAAMQAADMVVAMSAYKHHASSYADVLLPIAPFSETSGTFINTAGRAQSFKGAVKPLGEARPAWKVLRVLGNLLEVAGFDYDSSEAVRDDVLASFNLASLNNALTGVAIQAVSVAKNNGLQRVSYVPIYSTDAVVRRAVSLQKTTDAAIPNVVMHSSELSKLGVLAGHSVKVSQGNGSVTLQIASDDGQPVNTARIAAGHAATAALGAMFGTITVERA
ncbi:MAG: molybdopterin-dependent oxidoreductase, partial [Gallionella sp.]